MKIKTKDLIGPALDWAVAQCEGKKFGYKYQLVDDERDMIEYRPSSDWSHGGPIKTKHLIATEPRFLAAGYEHPNGKWVWQAHLLGSTNIDESHEQEHESELIAAMRCYVASKLGDEVEIHDTLIKE